jgi:hypothetical protein
MQVPDSVSRRILGFVPKNVTRMEWNKLRSVNQSFDSLVVGERVDRMKDFFTDILILEEDEMIEIYTLPRVNYLYGSLISTT